MKIITVDKVTNEKNFTLKFNLKKIIINDKCTSN